MSEQGREQRRRNRLRHGLYTMQKAVALLGTRALPPASTALGRELRAWRQALIVDLGGEDAVSTQQLALVDKAVTQKLIVDSLDAYVLGMPSLVNKRHRSLWHGAGLASSTSVRRYTNRARRMVRARRSRCPTVRWSSSRKWCGTGGRGDRRSGRSVCRASAN